MRLLGLALLLLLASPAHAEDVPVTKSDAPRAVPFRADAALTKAEAQLAEGKFTQAMDTLGGVLQRRPGDADALTYMGYAWMQLGEIEKATENFDRAIKYDPRHLGANAYRAELYLEAGDADRAREQLQAIRVICAGTDCPELDRLQAALNAHRRGDVAEKDTVEEKK